MYLMPHQTATLYVSHWICTWGISMYTHTYVRSRCTSSGEGGVEYRGRVEYRGTCTCVSTSHVASEDWVRKSCSGTSLIRTPWNEDTSINRTHLAVPNTCLLWPLKKSGHLTNTDTFFRSKGVQIREIPLYTCTYDTQSMKFPLAQWRWKNTHVLF